MMSAVATPDPVVLLHGFAGTGATWDPVRTRLEPAAVLQTPDLPGHGTLAGVRPVSFDACVDTVLACAPPRFVLGGYSLGGRVALHVALAAAERVRALVLVCTTAGIADDAERADRRTADGRLADAIQRDGLAAFARCWTTQPLFKHDPPHAVAAQRAEIARQTADGLAAALRGIGTGAMAPLWDRLPELTMPVQVVVGARDAKFRALGERLVTALPDAGLIVVPGAGHGLPREAPAAVARAIADIGGAAVRRP